MDGFLSWFVDWIIANPGIALSAVSIYLAIHSIDAVMNVINKAYLFLKWLNLKLFNLIKFIIIKLFYRPIVFIVKLLFYWPILLIIQFIKRNKLIYQMRSSEFNVIPNDNSTTYLKEA